MSWVIVLCFSPTVTEKVHVQVSEWVWWRTRLKSPLAAFLDVPREGRYVMVIPTRTFRCELPRHLRIRDNRASL